MTYDEMKERLESDFTFHQRLGQNTAEVKKGKRWWQFTCQPPTENIEVMNFTRGTARSYSSLENAIKFETK